MMENTFEDMPDCERASGAAPDIGGVSVPNGNGGFIPTMQMDQLKVGHMVLDEGTFVAVWNLDREAGTFVLMDLKSARQMAAGILRCCDDAERGYGRVVQ